jgi:hypothetical protein
MEIIEPNIVLAKMQLLGLDVGFSAVKATSGVATLTGTTCAVGRATATVASRSKLWSRISMAAVVAVDAPLLPTSDLCIRSAERLFARGQFQRRCKAGFSHIKGTGLELRRAGSESAMQLEYLTSIDPLATAFPLVLAPRNLVEAFPNAFLGVCVSAEQYACMPTLRRGKKFDWLYGEWCQTGRFRLLVKELASVLPECFASRCEINPDHEERAALICLATAACVASGRYTAVGEPVGGYFFLPPWSTWADWARTELNVQRHADTTVTVWIDGVAFPNGKKLP